MTFDQEVKLTLIGGMIVLSFVCSILLFRMLDAQDTVKQLKFQIVQMTQQQERCDVNE